jgi:hypothetical protein
VRQIATAKKLDVLDSARLLGLIAVARSDACIAIFDAKYHYEFWRPITAIRNGDIATSSARRRSLIRPPGSRFRGPGNIAAVAGNAANGAAHVQPGIEQATVRPPGA